MPISNPYRSSHRSALSSRTFRFYFGASCFSTFATWITRFTVGWMTWDLTHSALWVGTVSALMLLPTFLLSPIFGVLSDRISVRNGMLITTAAQAAIGAAAAVAYLQDTFSVLWLLLMATCIGAVTAAHHPMRLALIPKLVTRELLPSAIGLSAMVFNSSRIVAPAIGAYLIATTSAAFAFAAAALLFSGALLFLLSIRSIPRGGLNTDHSVLHDLKDGLHFIAGHPAIKLVLTLTLVNGLLGRSIIELLPAISGQLLGGDASTLAILTAFAGAGSILGGFIISRQRDDEAKMINLILLCLLLSGVILLPVLLIATLPPLTFVITLLSMTMTMIGTGCQALIQLTVDDAYRGRVLSIWTVVTMGVPAFGAFSLGAAADFAGFRAALPAFAVAAIAGTLVLAKRHRLVRSP